MPQQQATQIFTSAALLDPNADAVAVAVAARLNAPRQFLIRRSALGELDLWLRTSAGHIERSVLERTEVGLLSTFRWMQTLGVNFADATEMRQLLVQRGGFSDLTEALDLALPVSEANTAWQAELDEWTRAAPPAEVEMRHRAVERMRDASTSQKKTLCLSGLPLLTSLPSLPSGLEALYLGYSYDLIRTSSVHANGHGASPVIGLRHLPTLPASLRRLHLDGLFNLVDLPSLRELTQLTALNLTGTFGLLDLPLLPNRITQLSLAGNRSLRSIQNLPEDLREFNLNDCTALTEFPRIPSRVEVLELKNNGFERLGPLPASLRYLKLEGLNRLLELPALATNLRSLTMVDCPAITTLPALPNLDLLDLAGARGLIALPEDLPATLFSLNLTGCTSLRNLPSTRPPNLSILNISGCDSLQNLPAWVHTIDSFLGSSAHFPARRTLNMELAPGSARPLDPNAAAHEAWFALAGKSAPDIARLRQDWTRLQNQPGMTDFNTLLRRLGELGGRQSGRLVTPAAVVRVIEELLLSSDDSRQTILATAEGADADCHDRVLTYFNNLQAQARASELLRTGAGEGALLEWSSRMFKLALLDEAVPAVLNRQWREGRRRSDPTSGGVNSAEALEVQLALRERLSTVLDLPFAPQGLYTNEQITLLNDSDVEFAQQRVQAEYAAANRLVEGIAVQPLWQSYLQAQPGLQAELEALKAPFAERMNQLFEQSDSLGSEAYLLKTSALEAERAAAVSAFLQQKTEAVLRFHTSGYRDQHTSLRQQVAEYLDLHPDSPRIPVLRDFAAQLASQAETLSASASQPQSEQLRVILQLVREADWPNVAQLKQRAAVSFKPIGASYRAILQKLAQLSAHSRQSTFAHAAAERQQLLSWRQVLDSHAPRFSQQGHDLGAEVRQAPQAIWLDTDGAATRKGLCGGLALSYALQPSSSIQDNVFSAAAHPDEAWSHEFRSQISRMNAPEFIQRASTRVAGVANWAQAVDYLAGQSGARALLVHVGNHSVALCANGAGADTRYDFYDPNSGVWQRIADPARFKQALTRYFSADLLSSYQAGNTLEAHAVQPLAADSAERALWRQARAPLLPTVERLAGKDRERGPLQIGAQRLRREELFQLGADLGPTARAPAGGQLSQAQIATLVSGSGLRLAGVYRSLSSTLENFRQGRMSDGALDIGALLAEGAGEVSERRLGTLLQQTLARAGSSGGRILARSAGLVGNLLTLPFDLYSAIRNLRQAGMQHGLARQDSLFSGGMAAIGATSGLGLALAAAAGASLSVVGPAGLALGALMIAGSQVYAALRQVQEVEQWIALSSGERFALGWRGFTGQGIDRATEQRLQEAQHDTQVLRQAEDEAQRVLHAPNSGIGAVLYPIPRTVSRLFSDATSAEHAHQHVVQRGYSEVLSNRGGRRRFTLDAARWLGAPEAADPVPETYEVFMVASDDDIDVSTGLPVGANTSLIGNHDGDALALLINTGNGNDRVRGAASRANRIVLGSGNKEVAGGEQDDVLTLNAHPEWNDLPGYSPISACRRAHLLSQYRYQFDGMGGSDTLHLETRFQHQSALGYQIDLETETVVLVEENGSLTPLGTVRNIENLYHGAGSDDGGATHWLFGNQGANTLTGTGHDLLFGRGGPDFLRLSGHAFADGGDGRDSYQVSRLGAGDGVTLQDTGAAETSVVQLSMSVSELADWRIVGNDLRIQLASGASITILDVYQRLDGQRQRTESDWVFTTQDGFILQAELPSELAGAQDYADFVIAAHYLQASDISYAGEQLGVDIDLNARRLTPRLGQESAPDLRVVAARQGQVDGSALLRAGASGLVLDAEARELSLRLRYQTAGTLLTADSGEQTIKLAKLEYLLQIDGSELWFDALPWLQSPVLSVRQGQARFQLLTPPPLIATRDGYPLRWLEVGENQLTLSPAHQQAIQQAQAEGYLLLTQREAQVLDISSQLRTVGARAPYWWQANGPLTLDARYRLTGANSAQAAGDNTTPGAEIHRQIDPLSSSGEQYTHFADAGGSRLQGRTGARNLLIGKGASDTLSAAQPGDFMSGGDGADRYCLSLSANDSAPYFLDNRAQDGVLDTLELTTELSWQRFALARFNDDLLLGVKPGDAGAEAGGHAAVRVVVLGYFRQAAYRHLAIERKAPGDGRVTRISDDQLQRQALDQDLAVTASALDLDARIERINQMMVSFGTGGHALSTPAPLTGLTDSGLGLLAPAVAA